MGKKTPKYTNPIYETFETINVSTTKHQTGTSASGEESGLLSVVSGAKGGKRHKSELFILYTSVPFSLYETVIMCVTQYMFKVGLKIKTQDGGKMCEFRVP